MRSTAIGGHARVKTQPRQSAQTRLGSPSASDVRRRGWRRQSFAKRMGATEREQMPSIDFRHLIAEDAAKWANVVKFSSQSRSDRASP
jgi:hypothetical protein